MGARAAAAQLRSCTARLLAPLLAVAALATAALPVTAVAQTRCDGTAPRVELRIFRYATQSDEEKSRFVKFHQILYEDMLELAAETDIAELKVSPTPAHGPPRPPENLTGMRAGWEDAWCAALVLLSGSMDRDAAGVYQADSLIYWASSSPTACRNS